MGWFEFIGFGWFSGVTWCSECFNMVLFEIVRFDLAL